MNQILLSQGEALVKKAWRDNGGEGCHVDLQRRITGDPFIGKFVCEPIGLPLDMLKGGRVGVCQDSG